MNLTGCVVWVSVEREGEDASTFGKAFPRDCLGLSLAGGGKRSKDRQTLYSELV